MEYIQFENITKEIKKENLEYLRSEIKETIEEQSNSVYLDNIDIAELSGEEIELFKLFKEESVPDEDLKRRLISLQSKESKEMKEHPEDHQWTSKEYFMEFLINRLNVRHLRKQFEEEEKKFY